VPTPIIVTTPLETEHAPAAENTTARPEVAVAVGVYVSPYTALAGAALVKETVWFCMPPTTAFTDCRTPPPVQFEFVHTRKTQVPAAFS
jgi:hypothetical protein